MIKKNTNKLYYASSNNKYFTLLVVFFSTVMILSNIIASKPVTFFENIHFNFLFFESNGVITDAAFILFPLSYAIGGIITEIFGYKTMKKTILLGFFLILFTNLTFQIAIFMPQNKNFDNQLGYQNTLGITWIFLLAALSGYIFGELLNSLIISKIKTKTGESKLFLRLAISLVFAEFLDTLIFCLIVAKPGLHLRTYNEIANYIFFGFLWKVIIGILLLPITSKIISHIKFKLPNYYK